MATIEIRETRDTDLPLIAACMSEADVRECWASVRLTPLTALQESRRLSSVTRTVDVDGVPEAMFGLRPSGGRSGLVWLLGTDALRRHRMAMVRRTGPELARLARAGKCRYLLNCVSADNHPSLAWLQHLGAVIGDAVPMGPDGVKFRPFVIDATKLKKRKAA